MSVALAFLAAAMFAVGTYLLMQRKLSRLIIGLGLIGHAANVVFVAGSRQRAPRVHRLGRPR